MNKRVCIVLPEDMTCSLEKLKQKHYQSTSYSDFLRMMIWRGIARTEQICDNKPDLYEGI